MPASAFLAGQVEFVVAMLLVATVVSIATHRTRIPYTVALVILGLGAQAMGVLPRLHLTPELVMVVFLPALLFEAGWNLDIRRLLAVWKPVAALALFGVLVTVAGVAAAVHFGDHLAWPGALLLGAALSATDPVSVVALFREVPAPEELAVTIEGESLFNDGTAVAVYQVLLVAIATGRVGPQFVGQTFAIVSVGGLALGVAIGLLASLSLAAIEDPLTGIMLTTVAAYGGFLIGTRLGVSPVLTVVAIWLVVGNVARGQLTFDRLGLAGRLKTPLGRALRVPEEIGSAINAFWEYAAFVANSLLFLLVGLEFVPGPVFERASPFLWALGGMLVTRLIAVASLALLGRSGPGKPGFLILFWGGLRGALSLAMALGLPRSLPGRDTVVAVVYACVLFTLVFQGLSLPWLIRRVFRE